MPLGGRKGICAQTGFLQITYGRCGIESYSVLWASRTSWVACQKRKLGEIVVLKMPTKMDRYSWFHSICGIVGMKFAIANLMEPADSAYWVKHIKNFRDGQCANGPEIIDQCTHRQRSGRAISCEYGALRSPMVNSSIDQTKSRPWK